MSTPARRSFLTSLASFAALAAGRTAVPGELFAQNRSASSTWDLSWLDQLDGKHKQVFDVGSLDRSLHVVANFLGAHEEVFNLRHPQVNAVIGIAGAAFPINAGDSLWPKYEIGRRWEVKDPKTGTWAQRNVFLDGIPVGGRMTGVKPLQALGAIFWQCNKALTRIVADLSNDMKLPSAQVREEIVAGLNPGVHIVPAHTMLLGLCQERGCAYEKL
jgi:hypothetical protein